VCVCVCVVVISISSASDESSPHNLVSCALIVHNSGLGDDRSLVDT